MNKFRVLYLCRNCGKSMSAEEAYPSKGGYWKCSGCIAEEGRWGDTTISCPRCGSKAALEKTPDEVDERFDDYECRQCSCSFTVNR